MTCRPIQLPSQLVDIAIPNYDSQLDRLSQEQLTVSEQVGVPGVPDLYQVSGFQYSPPWINPPDNFQPFDLPGVITTPLVGSGDTIVLSYLVPPGYDGVIKAISHNYSAGGFQQGSGGFVWRLFIDGRAVKNYDNMLVEFGSVQTPRTLQGGIRIFQQQLVTYVINVAGGGGFIPTPVSQIICFISGYIYPRGLA